MAKVSFNSEINIKPQRQTFPKIAKLKEGDKLRIQLMDTDEITMDYFHTINIPIIEDGRPVYDEKGNPKTTFKGTPISFGDSSILEDKGLDVKNCPMSRMAKDHPDWIAPPKRKFAMHVFQYRTKPNSFEVSTPFNGEHKVWVFTDKTFLKLREFIQEWGDLKKHDLYITCTNGMYQNYDISVAPKAAWIAGDKKDAQFALDTWNAGKEEYPDLTEAIGNVKEKHWVEADLRELEEAWNVVSGKGAQSAPAEATAGVADFLASSSSSSDSSDDILANLADGGVSDSDDDGGAQDFDALLAGLNK